MVVGPVGHRTWEEIVGKSEGIFQDVYSDINDMLQLDDILDGIEADPFSDNNPPPSAHRDNTEGNKKRKRVQGQPRYSFTEDQAVACAQFALMYKHLLTGENYTTDDLCSAYSMCLATLDPGKIYPQREGSALFRHWKALKSRNRNILSLMDETSVLGGTASQLFKIVSVLAVDDGKIPEEPPKRRRK